MSAPSGNGAPVPSPEARLTGWRFRAAIWSVGLSATGYLLLSLIGGWREVSSALAQVGLSGIVLALTLSMLNYTLRFLRWTTYLAAMEHTLPWPTSLRIYLAGFALTTTPGKAGEALRGVLLRPWGVPYANSLAAFFSERLSDMLAILLLALAGLTLYPDAAPVLVAGWGVVLFALFVLSNGRLLRWAHCRIVGTSWPRTVMQHLLDVLIQARRCHAPRLMIVATVLGTAGWAAEAFAFYMILLWMGIDVSLAVAVFIFAISILVGALSFMPGGLGSTEGVMAALLIWQGAGGAESVAATVLIRLTTIWFAVAIGAGLLVMMRPRTLSS